VTAHETPVTSAALDATPVHLAERLPAVMTLAVLCETLELSKSTVYRAIKRGDLPKPRRIGGCARWLGDDVARALEAASIGAPV